MPFTDSVFVLISAFGSALISGTVGVDDEFIGFFSFKNVDKLQLISFSDPFLEFSSLEESPLLDPSEPLSLEFSLVGDAFLCEKYKI